MIKNYLFKSLALLGLLGTACGNDTIPNVILLPKLVGADQANQRVFVADAQNNNFSLIDPNTNTIVTEKPLLNVESGLRLPVLPQEMVVASLSNGLSRIFLIGTGDNATNRIVVLDYDSNGLRNAPFSPIIVGTDTASDQLDVLGGLALDAQNNTLFVSNTTDSVIRAFNILDGTEKTTSPISVQKNPHQISFNAAINRLVVSALTSDSISIVNTLDFTQPAISLPIGFSTREVISATNTQNATAIVVISALTNELQAFRYDLNNPAQLTPIGNKLVPPPAGTAPGVSDMLSGALSQLEALSFPEGRLLIVATQSSGDLGFMSFSADLTSFSQNRVAVLNGLGATGITIYRNSTGAITAYFAAPGGSAINLIDLMGQKYAGQIL